MCPALIFATNRTVKVNGRIKILIDSIIIRKGIKAIGAPVGARCAIDFFTLNLHPEVKIANHIIRAKDLLNHNLEVTP